MDCFSDQDQDQDKKEEKYDTTPIRFYTDLNPDIQEMAKDLIGVHYSKSRLVTLYRSETDIQRLLLLHAQWTKEDIEVWYLVCKDEPNVGHQCIHSDPFQKMGTIKPVVHARWSSKMLLGCRLFLDAWM